MRTLLAALFALALCALPSAAQAQCWGAYCSASWDACVCPLPYAYWGGYAQPAGTGPSYNAPVYPGYSASTYNPYADTSRIRIDLLPTTQAGWCARSYARGDSLAAAVWGC